MYIVKWIESIVELLSFGSTYLVHEKFDVSTGPNTKTFQGHLFAVHYEKIRNHLRETATSSAKIHSLARKYEHLRINQIQLRFLHFNQHSITRLGIHMGHWVYKREKYTFINANIKVMNTILKVNGDNWHTLRCKHYSWTFLWHCLQFNSIPGQP